MKILDKPFLHNLKDASLEELIMFFGKDKAPIIKHLSELKLYVKSVDNQICFYNPLNNYLYMNFNFKKTQIWLSTHTRIKFESYSYILDDLIIEIILLEYSK